MTQRMVRLAILIATFTPGIDAQLVMATGGPIPPGSIGLPPQPPFITLLGIVNPGKLATDPSILPKGPVSEVFHEELRTIASPAGPAGEVEASVRTKLNVDGQITERTEKRRNSETETRYRYDEGRLVSMETSSQAGRVRGSYWAYDSQGKLTEYRRTNGVDIVNHESNFHYDDGGRLLSFEYRQGADDELFTRTNVSYSSDGKSITVTRDFVGTGIEDTSALTLDNKSRVMRVELSSKGRDASDLASDIVFRYDEKDRLVEQTTDAVKFSDAGAEHDLPPGTISISYDDNARTKTTRYSFPGEGSLEMAVMQDDDGLSAGFTVKQEARESSMKLECDFDTSGNWTSCFHIVEEEGQRVVTQGFRRTITYR